MCGKLSCEPLYRNEGRVVRPFLAEISPESYQSWRTFVESRLDDVTALKFVGRYHTSYQERLAAGEVAFQVLVSIFPATEVLERVLSFLKLYPPWEC